MDAERATRTLTVLAAEGIVATEDVLVPPRASLAELERVHTREYLDALADPGRLEDVFGAPIEPRLRDLLLQQQRAMVGGTSLAARVAWAERRLVVNLGGGLHHAHAHKGGGFCVFNDVAVAIAALRAGGCDERVLVVDLDLHDGDGVRSIFARDPTVHTFSLHNAHWGPVEAVEATAIALGDGIGDGQMLAALERHLPAVFTAFAPSIVCFVAGVDVAGDDALGNWRVTGDGIRARTRVVFDLIARHRIGPVVWMLAGGYGAQAWRHDLRGLHMAISRRDDEPPTTEAATLLRYRWLARGLERTALRSESKDPLAFDEQDLLAGSEARARSEAFLGFYSAHGVEVALERYGVLERLRKLGYAPHLEISMGGARGDGTGDTLRVWGSAGRAELLVELRLRRDRERVPGFELLAIEWMLLQDPRARWAHGRRPLPGQLHPGLGMFDDVLALLVVVCERLGLDGIVVVPSHFHVAALWRQHLSFLDPDAELRYRSISEATQGLGVADASRALVEGRVRTVGGAPARWIPAVLVHALSPRLRRWLDEQPGRRRGRQPPRALLVLTPPPEVSGDARARAGKPLAP
jgi:acetoin utilization deacetylase AcuC-like enzyme